MLCKVTSLLIDLEYVLVAHIIGFSFVCRRSDCYECQPNWRVEQTHSERRHCNALPWPYVVAIPANFENSSRRSSGPTTRGTRRILGISLIQHQQSLVPYLLPKRTLTIWTKLHKQLLKRPLVLLDINPPFPPRRIIYQTCALPLKQYGCIPLLRRP